MSEKITTIRVKESTREALGKIGEYGESMDDIINKLLKKYEKGC